MNHCIACDATISEKDHFCPKCGVKIPIRADDLTQGNKIKIIILSILLFPFGLRWFFKYYKSENLEAKRIAYIVLVLNIVILVFLIFTTSVLANSYKKALDSIYMVDRPFN